MLSWWSAPRIVPIPTVCAKSAPKPALRVISSPTAASSRRNGSRTPGLSASLPALLRPKFWSTTLSRRSGASGRCRYRCFPDGKRTSSSDCRQSLQRADPTKKKVCNGNTLLQGTAHRRLYDQAETAWPQALPACSDAGTVVPLQSGLRWLRQDRLSRRDPQPPYECAGVLGRGR